MTREALEKRDGILVFLKINMGSFWPSQWFTICPLIGHILILDEDFIDGVS
jgi:hypothetical protein